MLAKLGRDCVGAIQLFPEDELAAGIDEINGDPLTIADIARRLRAITAPNVLGQHDHDADLRPSIAGAQEKNRVIKPSRSVASSQGEHPNNAHT